LKKKGNNERKDSSLGAGQGLHLNMTVVGVYRRRRGGERLIGSEPPHTNALGDERVGYEQDENDEDGVDQERQIENRNGAELGLVEIALRGSLDAALDVEKAVAALGDEGVGVEGEAGLEGPEAAEAEGGGEGGVGGKEAGEGGEEEAEERGEGGDGGGDGEALGLDGGGLESGAGGGEGSVEEEEGGGEGEGEVGGEGEEGGAGVGEEKGEGEEEEEEERGGGLEGEEEVDGGGAAEQGVGVGGEEEVVGDGDEEGENEEVELEAARVGEWVEGFGDESVWRFEVVARGADEVVHSKRQKCCRGNHLIH